MVRHIAWTDEELSEYPMRSVTVKIVVYQIDDQIPYGCAQNFCAVKPRVKEAGDNKDPSQPHRSIDGEAACDNWAIWLVNTILFDAKSLVHEVAVDDLDPDPE